MNFPNSYLSIWVLSIILLTIFVTPRSSANPSSETSLPASTQDSFTPIHVLHPNDISSQKEIQKRLAQWKVGLDLGKNQQAIQELVAIQQIKERLDTQNLPFVTQYLMAESRTLFTQRRMDVAIDILNHAAAISPDIWSAHWELTKTYFKRNPLDVSNYFGAFLRGVKSPGVLRTIQASLGLLAVSWLVPGMFFGFIIFLIILLVIHFPLLSNDFRELITEEDPKWFTIIPLVMILILPLALWGPLVFLLAVPIFFCGYLKLSARIGVVLFYGFLSVQPVLVEWVSQDLVLKRSEVMTVLKNLKQNSWDVSGMSSIRHELDQRPDEPSLIFAMGLMNKKMGNYPGAESFYRKLLEKKPNDVRTMINLANVRFLQKDFEGAVKLYKRVIEMDSNVAEAHYNLSNAYGELFQTELVQEEFNKAKNIDVDKTLSFVQRAGGTLVSKVEGFNLEDQQLKNYQDYLRPDQDRFQKELWTALYGGINRKTYQFFPLAGFVLFVLGLFAWPRMTIEHSGYCGSCGLVFRSLKKRDQKEHPCSQCLALSFKRYQIEPKIKEEKLRQIRSSIQDRSFRFSLMNLVFPGAGHLYLEKYLAGLVYVVLTSVLLVQIGWSVSVDLLNPAVPGLDFLVSNALLLGVAVIYYLLVNTVFRTEPHAY